MTSQGKSKSFIQKNVKLSVISKKRVYIQHHPSADIRFLLTKMRFGMMGLVYNPQKQKANRINPISDKVISVYFIFFIFLILLMHKMAREQCLSAFSQGLFKDTISKNISHQQKIANFIKLDKYSVCTGLSFSNHAHQLGLLDFVLMKSLFTQILLTDSMQGGKHLARIVEF